MLYDKRWDVKQSNAALNDAANYIKQHGWCRGAFLRDNGQACVLGALSKVAQSHKDYDIAYKRLQKHLGIASVSGWNDYTCKSQDEAVAMLVGAAS